MPEQKIALLHPCESRAALVSPMYTRAVGGDLLTLTVRADRSTDLPPHWYGEVVSGQMTEPKIQHARYELNRALRGAGKPESTLFRNGEKMVECVRRCTLSEMLETFRYMGYQIIE